MRKILKLNTFLVAGVTSILLVGFQNCSKYQYAAVDVAGGSNGVLNTDTLPDSSSNDVNQIGSPIEAPPVIGGGGSANSGDDDTSPPVIGGGGSANPSGDDTSPPVIGGGGSANPSGDDTSPPVIGGGGSANSGDDDTSPPVIGGGGSANPSGDGTQPPVIGGGGSGGSKPPGTDNEECVSDGKKCYVNEEGDEENDENDLEAYCNQKYSSSRSSAKNRSAAAVEISHRRGKMIITQDNIAHINLIEDFRGKLILCGVTVDKICNTRGSIVLVDSKVGQIEDHKGNIKIIGSAGSPSVSSSKTKINVNRSR